MSLLSQMFTISGIHVIHIHELKSYGHQTNLFVGIPGGWNISTVDHDELNIFLLHPSQQASRDCIAWQLMTKPMSTTAYVHQKRRHTQRWCFKSLFRSFAVDPILNGMQINLHKT